MPNVILEAMAAKLPIITTPAGDAGIAVEHGTTGYVVPFDDIDTLASYMVTLSSSAELRQKLGDAGRKRVEQFYSYDLLGTRLLDIYKEMENKYRGHGR
jgi:glycosyltransferase involved in cell wall biosynthesis